MNSNTIKTKFLDYMKKHNHAIIENISLVPINDPSLLFVNSGMFPLVNYLMGEKHPLGNRIANFQRCIRTEDLEEVGDNRHHTMFEMMGNWSLGDYFKEVQLPNFMELYVKEFGLDPQRIYVSVFKGDESVPRDDESIKLWKGIFAEYGIKAEYTEDPYQVGKTDFRIFGLDRKDNWWQRGNTPGELGGPDSEMYYDLQTVTNPRHKGKIAINDDSGRYLEIGNSVFMQYKMNDDSVWEEMPQKNVDFGGGFERVVSVVQGVSDNYDTDLFQPIIKRIEQLSGKKWKDPELKETERNAQDFNFRAIADHIRASVFILADGIKPANKDQGYILRRLIRRMIRKARNLELEQNFTTELGKVVVETYKQEYPHLSEEEAFILNELEKEELNFATTIKKGLKELQRFTGMGIKIDGKTAFFIYETYGFPLEMILEEVKASEVNDSGDLSESDIEGIKKSFEKEKEQHRLQSRAGAEKKFKGGLADASAETTRLHTAHHLLLAALQEVLGPHIHQKGSNITAERLRMDFSHADKLTPEQIAKVEEIVNDKINSGFEVQKEVLPKAKAEEMGAEMEFGMKYGDLVNVYFIKEPKTGKVFSKECCGGPHVENTKELLKSGSFKILKEESSGSGIRRIKAVLQ